jgi:hypothetical protein
MEKKGLCDACLNGKGCVLPTGFPVLQCEEYTDRPPKAKSKKKRVC